VDPAANDDRASKNGHSEEVRLLLQDSIVDPLGNDNEVFCDACAYGRLSVDF
jgi:hypothetical protein